MAAGKHDITIEQGATWSETVIASDESGTALNLTGYEARMHIRKNIDSEETLIELLSTGGSPRIVITAALGKLVLTIPASVTALITEETGVYDLEIYTGSTVTRLLEGDVVFSKEVTR